MNIDNHCDRDAILIVDDVLKKMQYVREYFNDEGYEVVYARDGIEAVETIRSMNISLVLIDITKPDVNCCEIIRFMKSEPGLPDIPVICLTPGDSEEDIFKGFTEGAVDCITKPFNPVELICRVKTHLELKRARDQILQNNREMARLVAMKDEFFSIIAHDLKNPFYTILGLTDLMHKNYHSMTDQQREQFIDDIHESAQGTFNLLENLLEWSRIMTSRFQYNPVLFAVSDMARIVVSLFRLNAREKNILLAVEGDADLTVFADKNMVETILRNLVSNAIKFTDKGGEVRISLNPVEHGTEITVTDTGIGMTEKDMNLLFRPDVHHTMRGTNNEKGTGLGLLLCHEMTVKNRGTINVKSVPGSGSVFTLVLPSLSDINIQEAVECHSLPGETAQLPALNNR